MQEVIRIDLNGVNCYLGKQDNKFILFDTGGHIVMDKQFNNRYDALIKQLNEYGCTSENLKLIVLTHGDNDHAANAFALKKHFGAKIAIHESDRALVETPDIDLVMKSFHYRNVIFKLIMLVMKTQIRKITVKTLEDYERFTPDIYLADGDSLNEYGFDAKIMHLPGHTLGSIAILTANGEFISGDTLANNGKPEMSPNAFDFALLKASVDRIKTQNIKTVLPGHGNPFELKNLK